MVVKHVGYGTFVSQRVVSVAVRCGCGGRGAKSFDSLENFDSQLTEDVRLPMGRRYNKTINT